MDSALTTVEASEGLVPCLFSSSFMVFHLTQHRKNENLYIKIGLGEGSLTCCSSRSFFFLTLIFFFFFSFPLAHLRVCRQSVVQIVKPHEANLWSVICDVIWFIHNGSGWSVQNCIYLSEYYIKFFKMLSNNVTKCYCDTAYSGHCIKTTLSEKQKCNSCRYIIFMINERRKSWNLF